MRLFVFLLPPLVRNIALLNKELKEAATNEKGNEAIEVGTAEFQGC
ncbi:hypothetical protein EFW58_01561 [Bacillus velezensis]|nr:hypothetical protein EFW58_01561 [Bacillus velezensis]